MSTRKIKDAVDHGTKELIYLKGHAKATYMSDGSTVEDTINNIESKIDLSDYVTTDELEGYAKIEAIPSLEGYVKESDLPNFDEFAKSEDIPSVTGYATQLWVESQGYAHQEDLLEISFNDIQDSPISIDDSGMINFVDESGNVGFQINEEGLRVTDVIAGEHKLSQKANASDIPSLDGYAKTEDIPSLDGLVKSEDLPNFDEFAKTEDIPSLDGYAKTSDIPSLDGYATEEWVNNKNYATEYDLKNIDYSSINNVPVSEDETGELNITDENGNIGMKVASEAVYAKDFVAGEHKLSEKVDKTYVDNSIAELVDGAPETLDTLNELSAALNDNADIVDVLNQSIGNKQDTITDLETIRQGAAKGATALQSVKTINGESIVGDGDLITDIVVESVDELDTLDVSIGTKARVFKEIPSKTYDNLNLYRILTMEETNLPEDFWDNSAKYDFSIEVDTSVMLPYDENADHSINVSIPTEGAIEIISTNSDFTSIEYMRIRNGWLEDLYDHTNGWKYGTSFLRTLHFSKLFELSVDQLSVLQLISPALNGSIHVEQYTEINDYVKTSEGWVMATVSQKEINDFLVFIESYINSIKAPSKTSELENDSNFVSSDNLRTINGESILGSGDITISGGSSSGSGAYSEVNHGTSDTTFTLTPNTFHVWDEVASLSLTLGSEASGVANEFLFQFTSGAIATTLSLPSDLKWANDSAPTIAENMIYQVSILKGLASVLEFSNINIIDNHITASETDSIGYILQYPNASELAISYYGPYSTTQTLTLPIGSTSFQCPSGKSGTTRGAIISITPSNDNQYNYILS